MSARTRNPGTTRHAATQQRRLRRTGLAGALMLALLAGTAHAATYNASSEAELVQAIYKANAHKGADQVNLTHDVVLHAALPLVTDALAIRGTGGQRTIRRNDTGASACSPTAANAFRLVDASADLTLRNLRLSGGCNLVDQGGAVRVQGAALVLMRSQISGNQTFVENPNYYYGQGIGGGVAVFNGSLSVVDSEISGNATHGNLAAGGGAAAFVSDVNILRSTISGNSTTGPGSPAAGLYAIGDYFTLTAKTTTIANSTIADNHSHGEYMFGGGAYLILQATTMSNSRIIGNSVDSGGEGRGAGMKISNVGGSDTPITIDHCIIAGNVVASNTGWGGGLALSGGVIRLDSDSIVGNTVAATGKGVAGGVWVEVAQMTIVNTTIADNEAIGSLGGGGAMGILSEAPNTMSLSVYNSTIAGNRALASPFGGIRIKAETADSVAPTVYIESTLLAGNEGLDGFQEIGAENTAPTVAARHSLVEGSVDVGAGSYDADAATVALSGQDPLLLPLADNGGPTPTRALAAGSPALGTGTNPLGLSFDQRGAGFPRAVGAAVDIGALESNPGN